MNCLFCGKRIILHKSDPWRDLYGRYDPAPDYPEYQFHRGCAEYIEERIMIVASRIERKHRVIISEASAIEIAELCGYGV